MTRPRLPSLRPRSALRAVLSAAPCLLAAPAAFAAGDAQHGGGGIPWGEIVKQAVNFSILVGALVFLLRKPVANFLRERSEMLRKSIDDAAKARAEAARKLSAIEERTAHLSAEIAQMNAKMDAEARLEAQALHEATSAEIERIRTHAEFAAEQEVKKARQELQVEASELAARAAEELVRKALSPEDQERLVRENIEKIEGVLR